MDVHICIFTIFGSGGQVVENKILKLEINMKFVLRKYLMWKKYDILTKPQGFELEFFFSSRGSFCCYQSNTVCQQVSSSDILRDICPSLQSRIQTLNHLHFQSIFVPHMMKMKEIKEL